MSSSSGPSRPQKASLGPSQHTSSLQLPSRELYCFPPQASSPPVLQDSRSDPTITESATSTSELEAAYDPDKQPWRMLGYPAFSKWTASCDDFFLVRRFGATAARVILMLQDQLTYLEEEIHKQDKSSREGPSEKANSGTFRHDPRPERIELLEQFAMIYERFRMSHGNSKTITKSRTRKDGPRPQKI